MPVQARGAPQHLEVAEAACERVGIEVGAAVREAVEAVVLGVQPQRQARERGAAPEQRFVDLAVVAAALAEPATDEIQCAEIDDVPPISMRVVSTSGSARSQSVTASISASARSAPARAVAATQE